jgi:hypothetical protein
MNPVCIHFWNITDSIKVSCFSQLVKVSQRPTFSLPPTTDTSALPTKYLKTSLSHTIQTLPSPRKANSMDSTHPIDNMEEDEVADFIRRTSRGETPAPEDHLMDRTSHVLYRSARSSMRPEFRLPWDELTTTGDIPAAQSGNASARSAGTSYNTMGRDARQDVSGVPSPRRDFVSARDFAEDSSSVSSYGGHGQPTGQGWGAYQRMDAPRRPTQEQPATGRSFFGSRSNNTRPEPEGQSPTTTRQSRQQQPAPAHNAQQGWSNPFSPSARRSTYGLSESSRAALNNPDSVVESIGTQRLMPSRDPMAAFYSPPRPRFATPYTEPASSIN